MELVHHYDSNQHPIFQTADGDIVHRDAITEEWSVVDGGRNGSTVRSGDLERIHQPYIADVAQIAETATVDKTATVEPGAKIGPHAFVGAFSSIQDGSRIAPGAIVGAGSRVSPTANVGAGARLEQRTQVDAFDNIAANTRTGTVKRPGSRLQPGQVTHLVERLAVLDRD